MANRHLLRSIAMQSLFEWDFRGVAPGAVNSIIERNIAEFAVGMTNLSFITALVNGVIEKQSSLDEIIEKAAPEWPIAQISIVDRNILRIGLYELLFSDRKQVPAKVAINEAIELAKTFGGESSGRFVNGVLGTVYKEIGEPGKDEVTQQKPKRNTDISDEERAKLPIDRLAGTLVYARDDDQIFFALVHDVFGYWTLTKGRIDKHESTMDGAVRKAKEEIGLDISITATLGENEYIASDPERGKVRKQVAYFLAESPKRELKLKETGGLDDARWFAFGDVAELKMYDDITPLFVKAIELLGVGAKATTEKI